MVKQKILIYIIANLRDIKLHHLKAIIILCTNMLATKCLIIEKLVKLVYAFIFLTFRPLETDKSYTIKQCDK